MREIEFRAQAEAGVNCWAYGFICKGFRINLNGKFNTTDDYVIQLENGHTIIIDQNTVGQYTGLKDKNGTKIFEGDIVREQTFGSMTASEDYEDEKEFKDYKKYLIKECDCIFDDEKNYHTNYDYKVEFNLNGFYPFADSPENCQHCGGAISNEDVEVIGNIYDNPELLEV